MPSHHSGYKLRSFQQPTKPYPLGFPTPPSRPQPQGPPYSPCSISKGLSAVWTLSDPQPPSTSGPLQSLLSWPGMPSPHTPTGLCPQSFQSLLRCCFSGGSSLSPLPLLTSTFLPQDTHGCLLFTILPITVRAWQATVHGAAKSWTLLSD